jgi:NADPH-dependent 2,4-dienoyl-CoA reductase/sulfur reductase-like enzyme
MGAVAMTSADRVSDVLIVGAGPAGLAAAAAAADAGASVALIDRGAGPGGQYWRHGAVAPAMELGRRVDRLRRPSVTVLFEHHVQTIVSDDAGFRLRCLRGAEPRLADEAVELRAARLVLATGAYDRHVPFPGWDVPGVYAAGGVQALLKEHGVAVGRQVVVAGTGPFLMPVATALLAAGVQVPLIAEANSPLGFALRPHALLAAPAKLGEAARYARTLARARVPYHPRHVVIRAVGTDRVEAVEVGRLDRHGDVSRVRTVACDALAVGWGFTPQLELHLQVGCGTRVDADGSLVVRVDDAQATSVRGVWAAGEATGVGGWELAATEGEIAGAAAAGAPVPETAERRRVRLRRFAAALQTTHPVPPALLRRLPDRVLVCRCEEVSAGDVRSAVTDLAATDARTVKLLTRSGMGWCQGRICGAATAGLTAASCHRAVTEGDLRAMAERPLAVPSTLRTLAAD